MIYRKAPQRPVRLLLSVAAVTSAAAFGACGGIADGGAAGSVCSSDDPSCASDFDAGPGGGIVRDSGNPCAQGCGLVPSNYDAGDEDAADQPSDGGISGSIPLLDAGDEDDASIIVGVVPER